MRLLVCALLTFMHTFFPHAVGAQPGPLHALRALRSVSALLLLLLPPCMHHGIPSGNLSVFPALTLSKPACFPAPAAQLLVFALLTFVYAPFSIKYRLLAHLASGGFKL